MNVCVKFTQICATFARLLLDLMGSTGRWLCNGRRQVVENTGYASNPVGYEPEGRAFESLRARHSDMNLGTSTEVPFFISETASLRAAVLPVPISVPTWIALTVSDRCW